MRFVFDIDGTLCFDGRLIDQTIIDTLLQLQHDGHELIFALSTVRIAICCQFYHQYFISTH